MAKAMLPIAVIVTHSDPRRALFVVAVATLIFLFVGIRNSWDAITYHVATRGKDRKTK